MTKPMSMDMMKDMEASEAVKAFVEDGDKANDLYAAMCNRPWKHRDGDEWSCSWRFAGGVVSGLRGCGDYMDHYCSGNEGHVTPEVKALLAPLGWTPMSDDEADIYFKVNED